MNEIRLREKKDMKMVKGWSLFDNWAGLEDRFMFFHSLLSSLVKLKSFSEDEDALLPLQKGYLPWARWRR
jgi:hypothetical protein